LTAAQLAQIFGAVDPAGDTPTASRQGQVSGCVWGTGVTSAQEGTDPEASVGALEIIYHTGGAGPASAAKRFLQEERSSAVQRVSGVGDTAYYCAGNMAAAKGSVLLGFQNSAIQPAPLEASEASAMKAGLAKLHS
jgi:hypothetical protein